MTTLIFWQPLSAARLLTGEEPYEVFDSTFSTPGDARFKEVEESVGWKMNFPSGLIASCNASYGCHDNKRYRFHAETGWFGMDPAFAYHDLKQEVLHADGALELTANPSLREENQFALEMDHMADCVLNNKAPRTPGEEGVQDHLIMDAIYQSARLNRPVSLAQIQRVDAFRNPWPDSTAPSRHPASL